MIFSLSQILFFDTEFRLCFAFVFFYVVIHCVNCVFFVKYCEDILCETVVPKHLVGTQKCGTWSYSF